MAALYARPRKSRAFIAFRPEPQNISALNCEASLGFSRLLIVSALAFPPAEAAHSTPPISSLDDLPKLMDLFHGAVGLYRMGWMGTLDINLSLHIRAKVLSAQFREIPAPEAEAPLNSLETSNIAGLKGERKKALYRMVISKLIKISQRSAAHPCVASFVLMWPAIVSAAYIKALGSTT